MIRTTITFWCLLTCAPWNALAQDNKCVEEAVHVIERFLESNPVPGLAVSVGRDGVIVWSQGFGYADLESRSPVNPYTTKFRIGSISKPITAAALARLYEEQKINLDATVQEYLPSFPPKEHPITIAQVAGHIAGIRHYRGLEVLNTKPFKTVKAGLAIFKDDPLLFEPGAQYSYSSYGWNLISAVVEQVSGTSFLSYVQTEVFNRLGMRESEADFHEKVIEGRTSFYTKKGNEIVNAPYVDNSYKWAAGGFLSSGSGYLSFWAGTP